MSDSIQMPTTSKYSRVVSFRVTTQEYCDFLLRSDLTGKTVNDLVRSILFSTSDEDLAIENVELQKRVSELEQMGNDGSQELINGLNSQLEKAKKDLSDLETEKDELENQLIELNDNLEHLESESTNEASKMKEKLSKIEDENKSLLKRIKAANKFLKNEHDGQIFPGKLMQF